MAWTVPITPPGSVTPVATPPATPAAAPNPAQTTGTGLYPWSTDPGYVAAQNSYNQLKAQQDALLRQERLQAEGAFNGAGNNFSFMANLGRQDVINTRNYQNSLAAHGILHSGELGYQAQQEGLWKGQQQYTAEQALLAQLNQYMQAYLGSIAAGQGSVNQALQAAYQNYITNPSAYGQWTDPNSSVGYVPSTISPYTDPRTNKTWVSEIK